MKTYYMRRRIGMSALGLWLLNPVTVAIGQTAIPTGVCFKLGLLLEQIALPGVSGLKYGVSPGIQVGAEYHYKSEGNFALFHSVEYGFSVNRSFGTSNILTTQFGPKYVHKNALISLSMGGGYNLFRPISPVYRADRGNYWPKRIQGKWVGVATASYGHQFGKFMPYASYGFYIDSPFINSSSTILPHQFFHVGLKMHSHKQ